MKGISELREQTKRLAGRLISARPHNPTDFSAQRTGHGAHSEIAGLPAFVCDDMQVTDKDSEDFGQWLFSVGTTGLGLAPLG